LLTAFFLPSTENQDELLDGDSPLSSFHAKINIAYRLGIIDKKFTRALNILRKIRNSFAHETTGCTLRSGSHSDRIKELKKLFQYEDKFNFAKKIFFLMDDSASSDFRMAIALMAIRLVGAIKSTTTIYPDEPLELTTPQLIEFLTEFEKSHNKQISKPAEAGGPAGPADGPREK
jgi:hypothetical protein